MVLAEIPPADIVARAAEKPGTKVKFGRLSEYPHKDHDKSGEQAARWLERRRRAVATRAIRAGVSGTTRIAAGIGTFTVDA